MDVKVRKGDTWDYYSQLFRIHIELLKESNPYLCTEPLQEGQVVHLPGFELVDYPLPNQSALAHLANWYQLPLDAIYLVNPTLQTKLKGQTLVRIPIRVLKSRVTIHQPYHFGVFAQDLNEMQRLFPFLRQEVIGHSVLGLPIYELTVGRGELKVNLNASFHANEWITSPIAMHLLNTYLLALTNFQGIKGINPFHLYQRVTLSVVPMVNPDGVNLVLTGPNLQHKEQLMEINGGSTDFTAWKANIRGVDLNNQFPANWEIEKKRKIPKSPAPRDFPGNAPLSEPEAIAMAELVKKRKFHRLLALHTQGEEFYWGYEGQEPAVSSQLAAEFEKVSGYRAVQYIDSHAGYKDWFIQEFKEAGFTIELGKGINPLPLSNYDKIYSDMLGIFLASMYM